MSGKPVSVSGRCDYPTREKESRDMERETTQLEGEVLGAQEWLKGIDEAYARQKNIAGNFSDHAMSDYTFNCCLLGL